MDHPLHPSADGDDPGWVAWYRDRIALVRVYHTGECLAQQWIGGDGRQGFGPLTDILDLDRESVDPLYNPKPFSAELWLEP